jgi:hypothetical protein
MAFQSSSLPSELGLYVLLLSRSRLCHYSVGGAWWHLCSYESFYYPVRVISPATGVESEGVNMTE